MTDDDLLDRMTDSTRWTRRETADVDAIIKHGRRRRRHRAQLAAGAVSTVVVLAVGIATQLSHGRTPPAFDRAVPTATVADMSIRESSQETAARLLAAFAKHVDSEGVLLEPWANTDVWGPKTHVTAKWHQGGGQGMVLITLGALPGVERLIKCDDNADVSGSMRGYGPWATEAIQYHCVPRMTGAGSVVIGTAEVNGVRSYLVSYYHGLPWPRVTVQVLGQPNFRPSATDPLPVSDPDVTVDQLIAAAIDPAMSVGAR